ncbi:MAG: glycosyltransferase [Microbacteriaceae bacterium]|nr:glycosyltransferase [Microbacteriaceae bacterium]
MVPRFGRSLVGGAETLVRRLSTRALPPGWLSEIATTCAVNHATWRNELAAGATREDGLTVHRFEVDPRDPARHDRAHRAVLDGRADYVDELEWLSSGVWSSELGRFLASSDHDLVIFCPYLFGTTLWGAQVRPERAVILPCLHDEPYARFETVRRVLGGARGCIFNAPAEERLARRLCQFRDGGVVGLGFDAPDEAAPAGFAERHGLGRYVLYAGRLEQGKRVDVAVEYATRHARERAGAPKLVLIGDGDYRPPAAARDVVLRLGFVAESEKRAAYASALALVNPSQLESLSIVLMEAWLEGTPAVVARGSEVMREHCARSGGGVPFDSYEEYRDAVDSLLDDPAEARRTGALGREYVLDVYGWSAVSSRFRDIAERLTG